MATKPSTPKSHPSSNTSGSAPIPSTSQVGSTNKDRFYIHPQRRDPNQQAHSDTKTPDSTVTAEGTGRDGASKQRPPSTKVAKPKGLRNNQNYSKQGSRDSKPVPRRGPTYDRPRQSGGGPRSKTASRNTPASSKRLVSQETSKSQTDSYRKRSVDSHQKANDELKSSDSTA